MATRFGGSVCAPKVARRATAKPVRDAFAEAMRRHGVRGGVLTDIQTWSDLWEPRVVRRVA
jgi:hypothetical protein